MYIYLGIYLLLSIPLFFIFKKLNVATWKAFVPLFNIFAWTRVLQCPWWWSIIAVLPGVNFLMLITLFVLSYRAITQGSDYGKMEKGMLAEALDLIAFGVIAGQIIHIYFFQPFQIPTSSMEKSLLVGDFVVVSKLSYGAKIVKTPLTIPFVHNTMPLSRSGPSYSRFIDLPYMRMPGFGDVQRNDVVVFNFPEQDTSIVENTNISYNNTLVDIGYHSFLVKDSSTTHTPLEILTEGRRIFNLSNSLLAFQNTDGTSLDIAAQKMGISNKDYNTIINLSRYFAEGMVIPLHTIARPIDKKDNYVKRCVGIAGDKLEVKDGQLYINDNPASNPDNLQLTYELDNAHSSLPLTFPNGGARQIEDRSDPILEKYNVTEFSSNEKGKNTFPIPITQVDNVSKDITMKPIQENEPKGKLEIRCFPHYYKNNWNRDNYGPLVIPKEGVKVELNMDNIWLYNRIISVYEGNELQIKDNKISINGKEATSYTFQQDYFWMMGDNRHNSLDARYFGFTPKDHIVGKAVFVGPNFNKYNGSMSRWCSFITDKGLTRSYLWETLVVIVVVWGGFEFLSRKSAKKQANK